MDETDECFGFKYKIYWPNKSKATAVGPGDIKYETGDSIHALNQEAGQWMDLFALSALSVIG